MKDEEIDRLFKEKADSFRAEPSLQAWHQLEKQLMHKKGKKVWWYISRLAAGILLLGGVWFGMEYGQPIAEQVIATGKDTQKSEVARDDAEEINLRVTTGVEKNMASRSLQKERETVFKPDTEKEKQAFPSTKSPSPGVAQAIAAHKGAKEDGQQISIDVQNLPQPETKGVAVAETAEPVRELPLAISMIPEIREDIIIRYSASTRVQDIGEFDDFPAEPEEEKVLSARAVVGFLRKVKENSSDGLSDIREAKDQLLSLRLSRN